MTTFEPPLDDDGADLARLLRGLTVADTHLESPPADLWRRIEAAVAEHPAGADRDVGPAASGAPQRASQAPARDGGEVIPLHAPRASMRSRRPVLAAVISAAAALVLIVGALAVWRGSDAATVAEVALSNDTLDPIGRDSTGAAKLVELGGGAFALDVDVKALPSGAAGFFELWIIDPKVEGMFSLGPVQAGRSRYPLPSGVDWRAYPIVDISVEPLDGVPTHSGKSVLRGVLT
jgi:hypothetical protein